MRYRICDEGHINKFNGDRGDDSKKPLRSWHQCEQCGGSLQESPGITKLCESLEGALYTSGTVDELRHMSSSLKGDSDVQKAKRALILKAAKHIERLQKMLDQCRKSNDLMVERSRSIVNRATAEITDLNSRMITLERRVEELDKEEESSETSL